MAQPLEPKVKDPFKEHIDLENHKEISEDALLRAGVNSDKCSTAAHWMSATTPVLQTYTVSDAQLTEFRSLPPSERNANHPIVVEWYKDNWDGLINPAAGLMAMDFIRYMPASVPAGIGLGCCAKAHANLGYLRLIQGAKRIPASVDPSLAYITSLDLLLHANRQAPLAQEVMSRLTDTVHNLTFILASGIDTIHGAHYDIAKATTNTTANIELHNTAFKENLDSLRDVIEKFPLSDPVKGVPSLKGKGFEEGTVKSSSSSQMPPTAHAPVVGEKRLTMDFFGSKKH